MLNEMLEKYVNSSFDIPASLKQPLANFIVGMDNRLCVLLGGNYSPGADLSDEIAERSAELMSVHYDQPLAVFETFLGASMKYSMGLWETGASTLEEAQDAMMADLCRKAQIEDGCDVLDIGCGFGSFAKHVLTHYPKCTVYGLTLSHVQADYIRAKQKERGHALNTKRFTLIQEDFNTVRPNKKFDRVVSIGVWEHISNLAKAQEKVRGFLKTGGKVLLHYIVYFESLAGITEKPLQNNLVARYIFPGGRIWSAKDLDDFQEHLSIEESWLLHGSNYERTIMCWLDNLLRSAKRLGDAGVERPVVKMWDLYFRLVIGTFHSNKGNYYGNVQYLLKPT